MKEPQPPITHSPPVIHHHPPPTNAAIPSPRPVRFIVLGAGSRGTAYAHAVTTATTGQVHAVAEPHPFKRREFGRNFIWGDNGKPQDGQEFEDWREWVRWEVKRRNSSNTAEGVDGVFVCTLDDQHIDILHAIAQFKDLHILCEKPLALSLEDCLSVYRSLKPSTDGGDRNTIFSIGHVLRYSPHNILLRKLLLFDRVIGDIVSLEHCEPVGWWHFSHSYVRGNWRRATPNGDGSLLTKSCHDIDFILWLLCSPPETPTSASNSAYHHPRTIASTGSLTQFNPRRKPRKAGTATNCLSCPAEQECNYSALKIYRNMHLSRGHLDWPVNIVCPDIEDTFRTSGAEAADKALLSQLQHDYNRDTDSDEKIASKTWYGRCVYESDNTVCDDQIVTVTWDDELSSSSSAQMNAKTAVFHMIAPTEKQCQRRGRVYGTHGETSYDSRTITIYDFATQSESVIEVPRQPPEEEKSHGGGDYGLARSFVRAVDAVVNQGWDVREAQARFVGCTLEEAVRSHAVVFAAEEARRDENVVKWKDWWREKLASM